MVMNTDILNLKTFKFKLRAKVKTAPFNSALKPDIISIIDDVRMPLFKYQRATDLEQYSTFIGIVAHAVNQHLLKQGLVPVQADKIVDLIIK